MIVPVLTLHKLQSLAKESFLFVPEIELRQQSANLLHPYLEIDICCLVDGAIVIGECKKGDKLERTARKEKTRLNKYKHIMESIGASRIIFSTLSDDWNDTTKYRIHEAFTGTRISVDLMLKDYLLTQ